MGSGINANMLWYVGVDEIGNGGGTAVTAACTFVGSRFLIRAWESPYALHPSSRSPPTPNVAFKISSSVGVTHNNPSYLVFSK